MTKISYMLIWELITCVNPAVLLRNEGGKKENEGENERKEGREGGKKTRQR